MDRSMAQKLNQSLQDEINVLKEITTKIQALVPNRAKLLSQYNENEMVKKELDLCSADSNIYKLVGPVLVKQEFSDAKNNVERRLEFFRKELERVDKQTKDLTDQQTAQRDKVMKLQDVMRKTQQAAVAAASAQPAIKAQ